jgi:phage baseplate assembly protein W
LVGFTPGSYRRLKKVINEDSVRTSINNIIGTFQGERIMLPEFASNLRSLVFEQTNQALLDRFAADVKNMIERWDDRVIVSTVSFSIDPDRHFVSITVLFMIRSYTEVFSHTVSLI